MWCTRFRFLSLVLVIYLVSLGDSLATAHRVVGMIEKNDDDAKGAKKVGLEITAAHMRIARSKWSRGRKMSAEGLQVMSTVGTGAETSAGNSAYGRKGKTVKCDYGSPFIPPHYLNALNLMRLPKITPKKSLGSTTKVNDKTSISNSALRTRPTTTIKKSTKGNSAETLKPKATEPFYHGSHDPFQRIGAKKPADAVTEMFNMLHKDYHTTGRRRPPINNSMPLKDPHVKR